MIPLTQYNRYWYAILYDQTIHAKEEKIFYSTIFFSVTWTASLRRAAISSSLESPEASIVAFHSTWPKPQSPESWNWGTTSHKTFLVGNIWLTIHDLLLVYLEKAENVFTRFLLASAYHISELDNTTVPVFWNTRRLFLKAVAKEGKYKAWALHYTRNLFVCQLPSQFCSRAGVIGFLSSVYVWLLSDT